eukprot:TRINITY_DN2825_c0_g1_i1.p1 TRINITY_DN2825_c0_g1~~TRINITY_DN2825_c0_g1_i1.p1  ORF type:complete len:163 (-),score=17.15 TRINITY_DN2825_c0_g1_i1:535-1023(-)
MFVISSIYIAVKFNENLYNIPSIKNFVKYDDKKRKMKEYFKTEAIILNLINFDVFNALPINNLILMIHKFMNNSVIPFFDVREPYSPDSSSNSSLEKYYPLVSKNVLSVSVSILDLLYNFPVYLHLDYSLLSVCIILSSHYILYNYITDKQLSFGKYSSSFS